ncbi:MAG: flagellar biosynthesis protein FliQ [Candidatus Hydrogenedentes bacterium]|nr:flagellar biosynthesis protein FliQ [Candidatus Hydrogenedentota bacterium]
MPTDILIEVGSKAIWITLIVSAPMLITGMLVGLIISIFQSVTQLQEITLTFVPKIIAVFLIFLITLPWISSTLIIFTQDLFNQIAVFTKL